MTTTLQVYGFDSYPYLHAARRRQLPYWLVLEAIYHLERGKEIHDWLEFSEGDILEIWAAFDAEQCRRPGKQGETKMEKTAGEVQRIEGEVPFLTREDLLISLMEECAEVIQACSKCLRFGYTWTQPGYGRNDLVLAKEVGDVTGIVNELHRRGLSIPVALAASHDKIAKMEQAKRIIGHVQEREQSNSDR